MGTDEVKSVEFKMVMSKGGKVGYYCSNCCLYIEDTIPHYCPSCALPVENFDNDEA